jgi:tRNA-modifying protein YgfZ
VDSVTFRAAVASRPRSFVAVAGPDAASLLERVVSNEVEQLGVGESCDALLLTPKGRVIAPLRIVRRTADNFLLLTEPELGERVRRELVRFRLAAKAEIELEAHETHLVLGSEPPEGVLALPTADYGAAAFEVLDAVSPKSAERLSDEALELMRIEARTPRWGREIDDRVLPAEAGLVERAVSLSKGCFPGQEPIARLHYRGHPNRGLRLLELAADELPEYDAEVRLGDKPVGRVTSAARTPDGRIRALAYVRTEVPNRAQLGVGGAIASQLDYAGSSARSSGDRAQPCGG